MDQATTRRPVALRLISGRAHYDEVVLAAIAAHTSVWVATANLKELMIEDHRAKPGVRRRLGRATYRSVLAALAELVARGVEVRFLHAERPSRPFREELAQHPELQRAMEPPRGAGPRAQPEPRAQGSGPGVAPGGGGGFEMRVCPRVHMKAVIVDGSLLYLGSANWTGAGLGVRGSGRRNFELGIVTDDAQLLDEVQALYERVWRGGECGACKLRSLCPRPLDLLEPVAAAPPAPAPAPRPRKKRKKSRKVKRSATPV